MGETHSGAAAGKAVLTPGNAGTATESSSRQCNQQIPLPVAAKTGIVRAVRHD